MNEKRTPEDQVKLYLERLNAGEFNDGIPEPRTKKPETSDKPEPEEDLDEIARDLREAVTASRELPPLTPTPPARPLEPTLRVEVNVPESQVVDILRARIPADKVDLLTDVDIVHLVTEHQQTKTDDPVLVDLSPYQERVRRMQQTASTAPSALNWPDTGGTRND